MAILDPFGPTVELAWACARLSNRRMLLAEYDAASDLALRAQAIAEQIGDAGVLSDALNTQSVCAARNGGDWSEQMRRALEIALSGNCQEQAGRAYSSGLTLREREILRPAHQCGDRRKAVHLAEDRRPSRVRDPGETRLADRAAAAERAAEQGLLDADAAGEKDS